MRQSEESLAQKLAQMKLILQGTQGMFIRTFKLTTCTDLDQPEIEVSPEQVYQLITLLMNEDILYLLSTNIHKIPFESPKDTQFIFSNALRYKPPNSPEAEPVVVHYLLVNRPEVILA